MMRNHRQVEHNPIGKGFVGASCQNRESNKKKKKGNGLL